MSRRSEPRLLVLHGLRLKGVAEVGAVAEAVGLAEADVARLVQALAGDALVGRRDGALAGWALTPAGRAEHERLLAAEADAVRPRVRAAYHGFRELNPRLLDVCSRWQVRELAGRPVRNDHSDPVYDDAVVADLGRLHGEAGPLCDRLGHTLDRYRPYGPRLGQAMARVRAGDTDYFTRPVMPSYHTVWFELHADLLATLGIDRAAETAAATGATEAAWSDRRAARPRRKQP
jgi:hypothetical protein